MKLNFRKISIIIGIGFLVVVAFFFTLYILVVTGATGPVPSREELSRIENPMASEVYSADSV